MKNRYSFPVTLAMMLVFIFAITLMAFDVSKEGYSAYAMVDTSPKYTLEGGYTWQEESSQPTNYNGDGFGTVIKYGNNSVASVIMENRYVSSTKTLTNNTVLTLLEYNISVNQIIDKKITSESFVLKKNGASFVSYTNLGTGSRLLYTSSLQDGKYDIIYQFSYKPSTQLLVRFTFTFSFEVDNTPPSYILTSNGISIESGGYTNGSIYYKMIDENPLSVYVKSPTDSGYIMKNAVEYACPSSSVEGLWRFKGRDTVGYENEDVLVYLDRTSPTGNIKNELGETITKEYYNKKFKYVCTDNLALDRCEYKEEGGAYKTYLGEYIQISGKYTFRGIDKAGNISIEKSITLDTLPPEIEFRANGSIIPYGVEIKCPHIKAQAFDSLGIEGMFVKRPGETTFSSYVMNSELIGEGKFEFYAIDKAGNVSEIRSVTVDNTPPTITLLSGSTLLEWENPTNVGSIKVSVSDNISEELQVFIKRPGEEGYQIYIGESIYSGGQYYFYAKDKAGNTTEIKGILVDKTPPTIFIRNSEGERESKVYYKGHVSLEAEDGESGIDEIRVKDPLNDEYIKYLAESNCLLEGEYAFYAIDNAGNISETKYFSIDNSPPIGEVRDQYGSILEKIYTNSQFITFSAKDNLSGVENSFVKKPGETNYEAYIPGGQLVLEGEYWFYATDGVGNVSVERMVRLDRKAPTPTMASKGESKKNGDISNSSFSLWGEDEYGISKIYLKTGEEDLFSEFTEETISEEEGKYYFFVEDFAGNISAEFTFIIDKTTPYGFFEDEEGREILSVFYSGSFKYLAIDSYQVERLEWKHGGGEWETYSGELLVSLQCGIYYFRSFDRAGNMSLESEMHFDNVEPRVRILNSAYEDIEKRYIKETYVSIFFEDDESGLCKGYIKYPGESVGSEVENSVRLQQEGVYKIWCIDLAGNSSEEREIVIDRTSPIASIKFLGAVNPISADYTNTPFCFESQDTGSGIESGYIKVPNSLEWEPYMWEKEDFIPQSEGVYQYKSADFAGNQSNVVSITYDITKPEGLIHITYEREAYPIGYIPLADVPFVKAQSIVYFSNDKDIYKLEVLLPGAKEYVQYLELLPLSEEGEYSFRAKDFACNISSISTVTLDRTPVVPHIPEEENGRVKGSFTVQAKDAIKILINGIEVLEGEIIPSIYLASYEIYTEDEAGNTYTKTISSTNKMGFSLLSLEEWWEIELEGESYSFSEEQAAIDVLVREEEKKVLTSFWQTDDLWNMGIPMESEDSKNAKPGTFYIYKSPNDKDAFVAYFTLYRLREVLLTYATQGLKRYQYFEKDPSDGYGGEQIYYPLTEKTYILNNMPQIAGLTYVVNGEEKESLSDLEEGEYLVKIFDGFGNEVSLNVYLLTTHAKINLKMAKEEENIGGESGYTEALSHLSPYYFLSSVTVAVSERVQGDTKLFIKDSNHNLLFEGGIDSQYEIGTSGIYYITTINRLGERDRVTVYISKDPPKATITENVSLKKLEIALESSPQPFSQLTHIKVFKSQDGQNFTPIQFDDYGKEINTSTLEYAFRSTGYFRVVLEDLFRYANTQIITDVYYKKLAPEGTLVGVENNGVTKQKVQFIWTDEGKVTLEKEGGYERAYISGEEIIEDGKYTLILRDYDNNFSLYSFSIKTTPPEVYVTGVANGGKTNNPVSFLLSEGSTLHLATRNGEYIEYTPGVALTAPGVYEMQFIDAAGNTTTYSFEITEKTSKTIFIYLGIFAGIIGVFSLFVFFRRRYPRRKNRRPRLRTE